MLEIIILVWIVSTALATAAGSKKNFCQCRQKCVHITKTVV